MVKLRLCETMISTVSQKFFNNLEREISETALKNKLRRRDPVKLKKN